MSSTTTPAEANKQQSPAQAMGSREKESQAGGREMGDSESSIGGDTSDQPIVNNEYPSTASEGLPDSINDKSGIEGSSKATSAEHFPFRDASGEEAHGYGMVEVEKAGDEGVLRRM